MNECFCKFLRIFWKNTSNGLGWKLKKIHVHRRILNTHGRNQNWKSRIERAKFKVLCASCMNSLVSSFTMYNYSKSVDRVNLVRRLCCTECFIRNEHLYYFIISHYLSYFLIINIIFLKKNLHSISELDIEVDI